MEPPRPGDEYIFHRHPVDKRHGTKPMNMGKLREWYEQMLQKAMKQGVVTQYTDLLDHVTHLQSVREFPLFEGDFFPDHLKELLNPPPSNRGPPGLARESSSALVAQMKNKTRSMKKRFLVAQLATPQPGESSSCAAAAGCWRVDHLVCPANP